MKLTPSVAIVVAVLAFGANAARAQGASQGGAQTIEFDGTPRAEELLELLAPEVPVMRSGAPPTPRKAISNADGSLAAPAPPVAMAPTVPVPAQAPVAAAPSAPARVAAPTKPHRPPVAVLSQSDWFPSGSAELQPKGVAYLNNLSIAMQRAPDLRLLISGHTDSTGNPVANDRLSLARAEKAVEYLVGKGIDPSRVMAVGRGPREPLPDVAPTDPSQRRVQVRRLDALPDRAG